MAKTNDDIEKEFPADGRSGAACANGARADACSGAPPEPGRVDGLFDRCPELLTALLKDHTTSTPATDDLVLHMSKGPGNIPLREVKTGLDYVSKFNVITGKAFID